MRIRWTIGAVIAVLTGFVLLPGIASADHHAHVNASTDCDGTFVIDADYHPSSSTDRRIYIDVNGNSWDDDFGGGNAGGLGDTDIPGPYGTTVDQDGAAYQIPAGDDDYFLYSGSANHDDFFVMNGDYDNVVTAGGSITVNADLRTTGGSQASGDDSATVTDGLDGSWSECVIDFCSDGDTDGGTDLSFKASPTNDCDPVRLCVDGESMTVTEFAAESLDGEKGSCTPSELAPPITTTSTETEPAVETVEPTEEAVAEVSPAVDVAALPSAGYGDEGGISYGWVAIFAVTLVGLGGATSLMARPRK